jgi:hypothetical protein
MMIVLLMMVVEFTMQSCRESEDMLTVEHSLWNIDFESMHTYYIPKEHLRRAVSSLCCFGPMLFAILQGLVHLRIELSIE